MGVAGEESLEHDEVPRYDLRVLWWKNGAVGSDTVEMTERSDVSDSRGTAGGAELQPEAALEGSLELMDNDKGIPGIAHTGCIEERTPPQDCRAPRRVTVILHKNPPQLMPKIHQLPE
ncbi:Hypothetical protein SMAX5B_008620 [Scophthalmus maximus]|uniref:Uncharacterized protein n=1 Tax=Scophthalmus maximus TaxID=52904 RepID=A0A2U9CRA0_SCOMX|nr:Hypothetical protein SMAX5B_008620 [Scophthalmus maximus]